MLDLCEILGRQLDITRRTVLNGAPGISVYKQKNNLSKWHSAQCGLTSCLGWVRPWALTMPPMQCIAGRW